MSTKIERIPKGFQRVEVYETDGSTDDNPQFAWTQQSANYQVIGDGQGFDTKASAKRSASLATGVVFSPGLDYGYLANGDATPGPSPDPVEPAEPTSPTAGEPEPYQDRDY